MGPEQQRLMRRLFEDRNRKLVNFNISPGDKRATAEELCAQVNSAMDQVEARRALGDMGDGPARSGRPPINVAERVADIDSPALPNKEHDNG